jgi:hypothetical protein
MLPGLKYYPEPNPFTVGFQSFLADFVEFILPFAWI